MTDAEIPAQDTVLDPEIATGVVLNVGNELVPVDRLILHPDNSRVGDVELIKSLILANGFYGSITVQVGTNYVLAGNHRLKAARELGMQFIPVSWVECDEATAKRILLGDNRANDLATYEVEAHLRLLEAEAKANNLVGSGYTDEDIEKLREEFDKAQEDLPTDEDIPKPPGVGMTFAVIVDCNDQDQQQNLIDSLTTEGFRARALNAGGNNN